jgi:hypothetical protein
MQATQIPLWVTIAASFGVGGFVGNLISLWLTSSLQRKNWVKDNKKLEWRELIDELEKAMSGMSYAFPPVFRDASDESTDWKTGMGIGAKVIRDRIFIATVIKERGIIKKWEELVRYVVSVGNPREPKQQGGLPTLNGYNMMVIELQDLRVKISREDLGID